MAGHLDLPLIHCRKKQLVYFIFIFFKNLLTITCGGGFFCVGKKSRKNSCFISINGFSMICLLFFQSGIFWIWAKNTKKHNKYQNQCFFFKIIFFSSSSLSFAFDFNFNLNQFDNFCPLRKRGTDLSVKIWHPEWNLMCINK